MKKTKTKKENDFFKFFNLKKISDCLVIHPDKMYNNFKGLYHSLSPNDCDNIAILLMPQVEKFFDRIGYTVSFKKNKS